MSPIPFKPALAALGLLLAGCSGADQDGPHIGYVEADWLYIASPEAGWVVEQSVREGDLVAMGDLLFRLDTTAQEAALAEAEARIRQTEAEARNISTGARNAEIQAMEARLREAEARLAQARLDRDRIVPLAEQGLEPRSRADRLITDVVAADAAVEALRRDIEVARQAGRPAAQEAASAVMETAEAARESVVYRLDQRRVIAQAAGRVDEVFLEQGEYATPGAPVLALLPEDGLKVRFFVSQAELPGMELGGAVQIRADGLPAPIEATVSYISPEAEYTPPVIYSRESREKLVFSIEARLPASSGLHPGLPVEISW